MVDNDNSWIDFGTVAHGLCSMQSQYCSRYIDGRHGSPHLGDGLRFRKRSTGGPVDAVDYHNVQINRDDAREFARRVNEHRMKTHQISSVPEPSKEWR